MVKFIHTSDWQLGMTRHYLSNEAQGQFSGDRINTIRTIGDLGRRIGADFIVVAGDVFETNRLPATVILQALDAMRDTQIETYLLPGNHDTWGPNSIYRSTEFLSHKPDNVHVLSEPGIVPVNDKVDLVAVPWTTKHPDHDLTAEVLTGLDPTTKTVRVLVGHGMLDILEPDQLNLSAIRKANLDSCIDSKLIHYVALGDRHIRWPDDDSGPIHYSGAHEATDFAETSRGSILEVDLEPTDLAVTSHTVGKWLFNISDFHLNSDADLDFFDSQLKSMSNANHTILKLVLTGTLSLVQASRLDEILNVHANRFASLEQWERYSDLAILPDEEFSEVPDSGYLGESIAQLSSRAESGDATASDALRLLYRLLKASNK